MTLTPSNWYTLSCPLPPALGPRVVSCVYCTPGISLMMSRYSCPTGMPLICLFVRPFVMAADSGLTTDAWAVTVTASVTPPTPSTASAIVSCCSWTCA